MNDSAKAFTASFAVDVPILGAPMARIAGGLLAAAVTRGGGLGFVGGGYGDLDFIDNELRKVDGARVGVGLITWTLETRAALLDAILDRGVKDVFLSFGDPSPYIPVVHAAGAHVFCQVQTVDEAKRCLDAGADVLVGQGNESGGHGRDNESTRELVPRIIDVAGDVCVLAAGGIATVDDLRWFDAHGAAGVVLGTRLYATEQSLDTDQAKAALVQNRAADTGRGIVFDMIRGPEWPAGFTGRSIRNRAYERWQGRESELAASLSEARAAHDRGARENDMTERVVWAGTGIDNVSEIVDAETLVREFAKSYQP